MTNDTSNVFKLAALQDSDTELIEELAGLSTLDYDRRRKEAAKELSVGVAALDKVVAKERKRLGLDEEQSLAAVSLRRAGHASGAGRRSASPACRPAQAACRVSRRGGKCGGALGGLCLDA